MRGKKRTGPSGKERAKVRRRARGEKSRRNFQGGIRGERNEKAVGVIEGEGRSQPRVGGSGTENELDDGGGVNEKGAESDSNGLEELVGGDAMKPMDWRGTIGRAGRLEKGGNK